MTYLKPCGYTGNARRHPLGPIWPPGFSLSPHNLSPGHLNVLYAVGGQESPPTTSLNTHDPASTQSPHRSRDALNAPNPHVTLLTKRFYDFI